MANVVVQHFKFASALQGFHIYKNTENLRPVKGQELRFHCKFDIDFNRFSVGKHFCQGN